MKLKKMMGQYWKTVAQKTTTKAGENALFACRNPEILLFFLVGIYASASYVLTVYGIRLITVLYVEPRFEHFCKSELCERFKDHPLK